MAATAHAATLVPMTDEGETGHEETRGEAIKRRMEAIGMNPGDLAGAADISRSLLYRVFRDEPNLREQSYTSLERTLDRIEFENGHGTPDPVAPADHGLIEFEVTGDFGVRVVVKGPIENAAELEESVARLIKDIRGGKDEA